MSKKFKILILAGIVVLFFFSLYLALRSGDTNTQTPVENTVILQGKGGQVQSKDFSSGVLEKSGDTWVLANNENFSIIYYEKDQSFTINLLSKPLSEARSKAEDKLLSLLNLDFAQACKLNVSVFVPFEVDETYAGQDFGLSFCTDSKGF